MKAPKTAPKVLAPLILLVALLIILGVFYPLVVWGFSHLLAPWRAEGSLNVVCGRVVSSSLISHYNESSPLFHPFKPRSTTSGLDPYVPLEYALEQVDRVANETGLPRELLVKLLVENAAKNSVSNLYIFTPDYNIVNVEEVNLEIMNMLQTCRGS